MLPSCVMRQPFAALGDPVWFRHESYKKKWWISPGIMQRTVWPTPAADMFQQGKNPQLKFDWAVPGFNDLPQVEVKNLDHSTARIPVVRGAKKISGSLAITQLKSVISHNGIDISVVGGFLTEDRRFVQIMNVTQQVCGAGTVQGQQQLQFSFKKLEFPGESVYCSPATAQVRYYLLCTVKAKKPICGAQEFYFQEQKFFEKAAPFKAEVGAENALQIEISVADQRIGIEHGAIDMQIHFLAAQKKMSEMRLILKRREVIRQDQQTQPLAGDFFELLNYQIMDGPPVRNEVIPVYIEASLIKNLTPSFSSDLCKVEYYCYICAVDCDGQNYYKDVLLHFYREAGEE